LLGENEQPLQILEHQMQTAAERTHFEQAARLRDDLKHVQWLSRKLKHFAEARQKFSFVYPVKGMDGRDCWYIVRHGELCAVLSAPRTKTELKKATRVVHDWLSEKPQVGKSIPSRPETVALISGWFRSNRTELQQVFSPDSLTTSSV
jgi:excinuclease UvrABC nuclease subunit